MITAAALAFALMFSVITARLFDDAKRRETRVDVIGVAVTVAFIGLCILVAVRINL